MNQNSPWTIAFLSLLLLGATLFSVPNLFGDDSAVQISTTDRIQLSPAKLTQKINEIVVSNNLTPLAVETSEKAVLLRFQNTESQISARDILKSSLGNDYVAALNLAPKTPAWLQSIGANPMKLGLDLRGGVHFLLSVDVNAMLQSRQKGDVDDLKKSMRDAHIRYKRVHANESTGIDVVMKSDDDAFKHLVAKRLPDYQLKQLGNNHYHLAFPAAAMQKLVNYAIDQSMTILTNRVNELGVSEAVVQRQGRVKITVDLPGIQDMARPKELIGKTASLRFQMEDDEHDAFEAKRTGIVPLGSQLFDEGGRPVLLKRQIVLQGDSITHAMSAPDSNGMPSVSIRLGGGNERLFYKTTAESIHKRLAVVYSEPVLQTIMVEGKPKSVRRVHERIISLATIQSALGNNFNITGLSSRHYAQNLALLLRSGALVAPVRCERRLLDLRLRPAEDLRELRCGEVQLHGCAATSGAQL